MFDKREPKVPKVPHSPAGSHVQNKTGSWRDYKRPVVDPKVCIRCGLCANHCPDGAIDIDEAKGAVINYDYCKGCLVCMEICPVKAIRSELENK